jgi:hypothetical protein
MDRLILALRDRVFLAAVAAIGFVVWLGLCHAYYESYWGGTIRRVQTVDFNMLHHMMPATLSYWVLTGQDASIQSLLDSNYGIFGMVVTDPKGKRIIYKTDKVYHDQSWQKELAAEGPDFLKQSLSTPDGEPFDVLTDPPPPAPVYRHLSPRADKAVSINEDVPNNGREIGRIYYLRQPPPAFFSDLASSLFTFNWWELSGSRRGYQLYTLNVIAYCAIIALIYMWRKEILKTKSKALESLENELTIRRRALDHLNLDLSAQRQRKEWLENEAELAYHRATRLKDSLSKLKEALFMDMSPPASARGNDPVAVRPPLHPPSAVIEEVESILPELTNNAKILRSQAEVLQSYCSQLEHRQSEMQQILEHRASSMRMSPQASALTPIQSRITPEQKTP